MAGLYIHIPFCLTICPYCNFFKKPYDPELERPFIQAMSQEIKAVGQHVPDVTINTIYYGGGTPTALSAAGLVQLNDAIRDTMAIQSSCEVTIEANPLEIKSDHCEAFLKMGVNRVSLGAQSSNIASLVQLGRDHQWGHVIESVRRLRAIHITNISLDLMYGTPGLTLDSLSETLTCYTDLKPRHVSAYGLLIEPGTPFYQRYSASDPDSVLEQYRQVKRHMESHGLAQYELSAFAQPGYESQHNKGYWQFKPYLGIGPGAHSFMNNQRFRNISSLSRYLDNPVPVYPTATVDVDNRLIEYMMVGLRLIEGIDLSDAYQRFNIHVVDHFASALSPLKQQHLVDWSSTRLWATDRGLEVLDSLIEALL